MECIVLQTNAGIGGELTGQRRWSSSALAAPLCPGWGSVSLPVSLHPSRLQSGRTRRERLSPPLALLASQRSSPQLRSFPRGEGGAGAGSCALLCPALPRTALPSPRARAGVEEPQLIACANY